MINNKEIKFLNMETPKDNKPNKEDLQIKKLQLQIEEMKEKRQAKQTPQKSTLSKTINILIYMFLAPFLIIGFFAIECAKASAGSGRRRR